MSVLMQPVSGYQLQIWLWALSFVIIAFGLIDRKPPLVMVGLVVFALGVVVPLGV